MKPNPRRAAEERRERSLELAIEAWSRFTAGEGNVKNLLDAAAKIDTFITTGKVPKK